MWVLYETYHDVTYFTPESRAATDALGCKGGWMGYFGMRAAPLGAATAGGVASAFYSFHPALVGRALPDAWTVALPQRYLDVRLAGADACLRRMLGDDLPRGQVVELTVEAARQAPVAGRPMAAANAALDLPEQPHLALWQACTTLRESRGDGHVAALVAADLDPGETLVLFEAATGLGDAYLRGARGWPEDEWARAADRLTERGLLADGALTGDGAELHRWVEKRTDAVAEAPWRALGTSATERLAAELTPLVKVIAEANEVMRVNPMALDARSAL
jgi:hypothetical protein